MNPVSRLGWLIGQELTSFKVDLQAACHLVTTIVLSVLTGLAQTTSEYIYTYLGTGVYAIYSTAGAFEDSRDHGIYIYIYIYIPNSS